MLSFYMTNNFLMKEMIERTIKSSFAKRKSLTFDLTSPRKIVPPMSQKAT